MRIRLVFGRAEAAGCLQIYGGSIAGSAEIPAGASDFMAEIIGGNLEMGANASRVEVKRGCFPFAFFLRDVSAGAPIWVPEAECAVLPGDDARSYAQVIVDISSKNLQSDAEQLENEPEESYENACRNNRNQTCPVWLGLGRDLRIFRVDAQEDTGMWGHIVPCYHSKITYYEPPLLKTRKPREIFFEVGPGANCCPHLERRLEDGVLPILHAVQYEKNVEYRLTLFASLENAPVTSSRVRGSKALPALSQMHMGRLTPEESSALEAEIKQETTNREEEVVLFIKVEAVNVGKTPAYAWFKAPHVQFHHRFADGLCFEEDKVFAAVLLNGKKAANEEYAILIQPGKSVNWETRIFHTPVEKERGRRILSQTFEEHHQSLHKFWGEKLASAAQISIPEAAIDERIKAGLLHLDINTLGLTESGPLLPGVGWYSPIGTESAPIIQFFDAMGWSDTAERCIDFFLSRQREDGFIQVYFNYESETGPVLWTAANHFRVTRNLAWLKKAAPALKKSCDYLLAWRKKNKKEELRAIGGYGLLSGKVADPDDFYHSYFLNAGTLLGLSGMAEVLQYVDADYADKLAAELVEYRRDLLNSLEYSRSKAPVIPLEDGSWTPLLPPWSEYHGGITLYADGGKWFSHGSFASRSSLAGPLYFALTDLLEPQSSFITTMLKSNQHPVTRKNAALSQPYYSRHDIAHLRRGEVKLFLKAFYNQFTAMQDRQSYTFWEHYYHLSSHKTHEEGWFLMQCRWMLAWEEGNTLKIFPGVPRRWLEPGKEIVICGLCTNFGKLNVKLHSGNDRICVAVAVERPPETFIVRLPHPGGKLPLACSGGTYDGVSESVKIAGTTKIEIELKF